MMTASTSLRSSTCRKSSRPITPAFAPELLAAAPAALPPAVVSATGAFANVPASAAADQADRHPVVGAHHSHAPQRRRHAERNRGTGVVPSRHVAHVGTVFLQWPARTSV